MQIYDRSVVDESRKHRSRALEGRSEKAVWDTVLEFETRSRSAPLEYLEHDICTRSVL